MIFVHRPNVCGVTEQPIVDRHLLDPGEAIPPDTVWVDTIEPTRDEDRRIETFLGVSVPTREEMQDIEPSELLYAENGARYLTARLLAKVETDDPCLSGLTFILKGGRLVTVRYVEFKAFSMFVHRAGRPAGCAPNGEAILSGLVDTIIDRAADILQLYGERIDGLSTRIFMEPATPGARNSEFQGTLRALGRFGEVLSKLRESLVSVERILLFLSASYRAERVPVELREQVRTTLRDLQSLEEHASFLSSKIQFLLDATLGLVNLEQNNIIKLFSVMAVIFMPPTLIASIYGMNFKHMPELDWTLGYPMAILFMVIAAVLPYVFFRWKRWL